MNTVFLSLKNTPKKTIRGIAVDLSYVVLVGVKCHRILFEEIIFKCFTGVFLMVCEVCCIDLQYSDEYIKFLSQVRDMHDYYVVPWHIHSKEVSFSNS